MSQNLIINSLECGMYVHLAQSLVCQSLNRYQLCIPDRMDTMPADRHHHQTLKTSLEHEKPKLLVSKSCKAFLQSHSSDFQIVLFMCVCVRTHVCVCIWTHTTQHAHVGVRRQLCRVVPPHTYFYVGMGSKRNGNI